MSQENVEIVQRDVAAVNRRDIDACLALMDRDIQCDPRCRRLEAATTASDGRLRRSGATQAGIADHLDRSSPSALTAYVGACAAQLSGASQGHDRGDCLPQAFGTLARWQDQRVVHFFDRAEALEAAGLSEQDAHADS